MKLRYRPLIVGSLLCLPLLATISTEKPNGSSQATIAPKCYFSPQDHVDDKLITFIESEKEDIRIAAYCLTHRGVIKSLIEARKRGVNVEVIFDPFTIKARSPLRQMAQAGISLYVWDPASPAGVQEDKAKKDTPRKPLMHNKFCVFGKKVLWSGSFNFTSEASLSNQENVLVLHDSLAIERYLGEFERIKNEGCTPYRVYLANQAATKKKKFY